MWMTDEHEPELREMVRALAEANGLHPRWVALSALQAVADTAIGELLGAVDSLRAERDALHTRAEAAEAALAAALAKARAEGEAAGGARAMAVVKARLAEVSQHDYLMRSVYGSHDKDREAEIKTLQRMLQGISDASAHVAPAPGGTP